MTATQSFIVSFYAPTLFNLTPPTSLSLCPSEDKLWLGSDIPSNLQSQHRVKRARVLQRKLLYATAAVPKRETGPSTEQEWGPLKKNTY